MRGSIEAVAASLGVEAEFVSMYLDNCDDFEAVPGGLFVVRNGILHIHAVQKGLSGRNLVRAVNSALDRFFQRFPTLRCPVKKDAARAQKFVNYFGFRKYSETDTHFWYVREKGQAI